LIGDALTVPLVTGESTTALNLDFAASAPPLRAVADSIAEFLPWYASVGRGAGFPSEVCTEAYESARRAVSSFVSARPDDTVIFTRHTTDALNLLARCLPPHAQVVTFDIEHHANLLPWREHEVIHLPTPPSASQTVEQLDVALRTRKPRTTLVAVTGASNVTGERWPVRELAAIAHSHGARIVVDAAQLAPHAPIDIARWDIDYLAVSGHKLYAPYGIGALVGRPDWLERSDPYLAGGGAVRSVTLDDVAWTSVPQRHEGGTPNLIGALALGTACRVLQTVGMQHVANHDEALVRMARAALQEIVGVDVYGLWPESHPRIGVISFNVAGYHHSLVAAALAAEYGISVRSGCFCAQPLMLRLLEASGSDASQLPGKPFGATQSELPGAVRISFGLSTTYEQVARFIAAIQEIVRRGPRWTYSLNPSTGRYGPDPDPRPRPELGISEVAARMSDYGEVPWAAEGAGASLSGGGVGNGRRS
jgi:selenocysteine lyase/cysteine desulfurase